MAVVIS